MRAAIGAGPAILLLGAWLTCYHFMYYDVLLAFLPAALLFADPRRYLDRFTFVIASLFRRRDAGPLAEYLQPALARSLPRAEPMLARPGNVWVLNRFVPTLLLPVIVAYKYVPPVGTPVEVAGFLVLWLWCVWLVGIRWDDQHPPRLESEVKPTNLR